MTALVVDASAVVELVLSTSLGQSVLRALAGDQTMHAPDLIGAELVSVLRKLTRSGELAPGDAEQALRDFESLGVEIYELSPFLSWALELREALTAYDAMYVALAESLQARLLTCDAKLAGANGHRATIELVR